jgi:hypothetical protein
VPPEIYLELLKYSPLPETLTAKISQIAQQASQQQQQNPAMMLAAAKAQTEQARAKLMNAQAGKAQMDVMIGSHEAQAENNRTQVQALEAAQRSEQIRAQIEQLRSSAILNLSKAGAAHIDAGTQQALAVLQALDSVVGWRQNAAQIDQQEQVAA